MEIKKLLQKIKVLAIKKHWDFLEFQENIGMVSFIKSDKKINIYLTIMTVVTCINHPKKGKTQLFRKNRTFKEIEYIFNNPRTYNGNGDYTK